MSPGVMLYLASMATVFVGQRLVAGHDVLEWVITGVGLLGLVAAASLRLLALRSASQDGLRFGHRLALMFLLVGVASLVMYAATTKTAVQILTLGDDAQGRWLGVWQSLWPIVWLLGTLPLLCVDWALVISPVVTPARRVRELASHGVVAALGIAFVFPINYVASKRNERWDLSYFKTPSPGTATSAVVEGLENAVTVRIFMPPSSEVAQELRGYFESLQGPQLVMEIIDQAAEPALAKALSVRQNGVVAFTVGEVDLSPPPPLAPGAEAPPPKAVTRTLRVDDDFDKAKRTLAKLDQEVQRILIEIGHGVRTAYVTEGHGELQSSADNVLDHQMKGFKQELKDVGFEVKPLGIRQGLAEAVPEDADLVMVLGPRAAFQPTEVDALRRYVEGGGALLLAREPKLERSGSQVLADPLDDFMADILGLKLGEGVLAAEQGILPLNNNKLDRFYIGTDSFTSHPSIATLAELAGQAGVLAPASGYLEEVDGHESGITFTVRSLAIAWADLDGDAEFEADAGETKAARNLVAAVLGAGDSGSFRAVVTADASMFSDLVMGNAGNIQLTKDVARWLVGAEALSGTTEREEDVKVEHTKADQVLWFYLTVLGMPLGVLVLGAIRIRFRRRGGGVGKAARGGPKGGEA